MRPIPQGSVTAYPIKRKSGRMGAVAVHEHSDSLYAQRTAIRHEYTSSGGTLYGSEPVSVNATFVFVRPKSVSERRRPYNTVKPDIDKLLRAVLDALTGVAYRDDAQVVSVSARKLYGDSEQLIIEVSEYDDVA